MTEKLKQKAEESAEKFFGKPTDLVDLDNLRIFKNGYLAGAKENGIQWHDLRKNPSDLPNTDRIVHVQTKRGDTGNAFHDGEGWQSAVISGIVIAWCEEPRFKE